MLWAHTSKYCEYIHSNSISSFKHRVKSAGLSIVEIKADRPFKYRVFRSFKYKIPLLEVIYFNSIFLDVKTGSLVWWLATLHIAGGWNEMSIVVLCNPGHSTVLWFYEIKCKTKVKNIILNPFSYISKDLPVLFPLYLQLSLPNSNSPRQLSVSIRRRCDQWAQEAESDPQGHGQRHKAPPGRATSS